MNTKPAAQLSLEAILQRNVEEAARKRAEADQLLAENAGIEAAMHRVLSEPPSAPASRLVAAFKNGEAMKKMELENAMTATPGPSSSAMLAEKEVLYAALAIVRSWKRRRKKNWQSQEKELMNAVERLTWGK